MKTMNKFWWLALLKGVILIILSFYVMRHPVSALISVAIYIGISLLVSGIFEIIAAMTLRSEKPSWGWGLVRGIIDFLFGIMLLSSPIISASSLPFVVGFWILFYGVVAFINSFQSRKEGSSYWWVQLLFGILAVIAGYNIANNIVLGALAITSWMGIGFLFAGIANIGIAISLRQLTKGE